jgi:hypothetical protein
MDRGVLRADDPLLAAHHFIGLLLWGPINRAMFTGRDDVSNIELEQHAAEAVRIFWRPMQCHLLGCQLRLAAEGPDLTEDNDHAGSRSKVT